MSELPMAPVRRIIKNSGARRVSNDAVAYLNDALTDKGTEIAMKANKLAAHAGRQTISVDDIKLAMK